MSAPNRTSQRPALRDRRVNLALAVLLLFASAGAMVAFQQTQPPQASDQAELTSHDTEPTFRLRSERNLVVVRAVVRDGKGNIIDNLRQEDFRLMDNGKPQVISHFSVERATSGGTTGGIASQPSSGEKEEAPAGEGASAPRRFVALFIDDIHMQISDMMQVKRAAEKYLASSVLPGDRIGVSTATGRVGLNFTNDLEKVRATIARIIPHPLIEPRENDCPEILDYQAYKIVQERDEFATNIAYQEYYHCNCEQYENSNPSALQYCEQRGVSEVQNDAMEMMNIYETNSEAVLRGLENTIRSLATYPGQRAVVLVSPGFLTRTFEAQLDKIADRAIHANVTVNAIDAKGLYAPIPGGDDISRTPVIVPRHPEVAGQKEQIRIERLTEILAPLSDLAADTGGVFFHNDNDLAEGFRRTGSVPSVYYVLAFSPTSLKADGRLHSLKVKVVEPSGLVVQARRGYFAPSSSTDPAAKAKEEIEEAVFSQDQVQELAVDVHTQFFRADTASAKLSVLTHVNIGRLRFRKQGDRNMDNLTLITAVFDNNGQIVTSQQKTVEMRLRDATLTRFGQSGITIKTVFDVKPGTYLVREVVRDTEGAQLSGLNRTVEIPN